MSGHAPLPKKDFTVVANFFFDLIMPRVSPAEWKTICVVIRDTAGWRCGVPTHPESCRRAEAEISVERFMALTGLGSQAVVAAILKARGLDENEKPRHRIQVIKRHAQQTGRQRTFRYSADPKANLKGLPKPDLERHQELLPFASDSENQNPSRMVKIKIPKPVTDGENQNPNGPVLRSIKESRSKETHTLRARKTAPVENATARQGVCVSKFSEEERTLYAEAQERPLGGGWITVSADGRSDGLIQRYFDRLAEEETRHAEWEAARAKRQQEEHDAMARELREYEERKKSHAG